MNKHRGRARFVALLSTLLGLAAALVYRDELSWNVLAAQLLLRTRGFRRTHRKFVQNIRYGAGSRNRLDIYSPVSSGKHPVLIWVHGGSWNAGDKQLYTPLAARLVPHGIVTVLVNYGLYPNVIYPQPVHDVATAVRWTLQHIEQFGGDPQRVYVCGHSAGAHLSALALFQPQFYKPAQFHPTQLAGWIGVSGPYDLPQLLQFLRDERNYNGAEVIAAMGGTRNLQAVSPVQHIPPAGAMCRSLLLHGEDDKTVPAQSSRDLFTAMQANALPVELHVYPKTGHSEILLYGSGKKAETPGHLLYDMVRFIESPIPQKEAKLL